ncbi:SdrD B-like domain-containing protein [Lentzea waywayandensis]|uniref:SdrD B-like domain-containing protein n=1 Tax=Lentzea waywayandensis TaxID=84724 RepID=UPI0011602F84|nr:SdrD B-like domain-containing protein [Lentzea waywayandensis]
MTTAAILAFGTATSGAQAQEPETPTSTVEPTQTTEPSTPPSEPSTPPSEPSTPPSEPSTPPSTPPSEPSTPPSTPPSEPGTPPSTPDTKPEDEKKDAPPVIARADEQRPDLAVTVTPDKAEFAAAEDIGLTLTVKNKGDVPAVNIRFGYETSQAWLFSGANELSSRPTLAPGAEKVFRVVLRPTSPTSDSVSFQFRATIDGSADPTPGDNGKDLHIPVRQYKGSVSGVVYTDTNNNGAYDQGEGLPNISFRVQGGSPAGSNWGFTDANGAYTMWSVVAGKYSVVSVDNDRRAAKPGFTDFVVEADKTTQFALPVVAPVRDSLTATMSFGKSSYHVSEKPELTITLKNSGAQPIERVVAVCSGYGPEYLNSDNFSALRPDGPGVTVPAGGETTVSVTTDMPKLDYPWIYANCFFGNTGRSTSGSVWVGNVRATVTGLHGDYSGKVVNAETGEPLRGAAINVLDPVTRRSLKDVIAADQDGNLRIYSLNPGKVLIQVAGKWKPQDGNEFLVDIVADKTTTRDLKVVPSDVDVPDVSHRPDLTVSVKFDKDSYDIAEPMRANITVKNIGTGHEAQVSLRVRQTPDVRNVLDFDRSQLGDIADETKKVFLWPGESREITVVGTAPYLSGNDNKVSLPLEVSTPVDHGPANNSALATTTVTYLNGDAAVVLYGDANKNGRKDADEQALPNVKVYISGGNRPSKWAEATTDESGRVAFKDFPVGLYSVYASYPDGWVRPGSDRLTVSANAEAVLEIGAERPLSDKFFATLNFTKDEYRADENYEAVITLENQTGADMPVVNALCSGAGEPGEIYNTGSGWGGLAWDGGGVSVPNGEKRTFRVTGPLPTEAASIGYATLGCHFAPDSSDPGAARAHDDLKVPGLRADAFGKLVTDGANGDVPKPATTVVVVEAGTKKVAARTITDADGNFGVSQLPVGRYDLIVPGPWKVEIRRMNPWFLVRAGGQSWVQLFHLVPGPEVEDPGYPLPEDQTPGTVTPVTPGASGGAGAGTAEVLAKTGASVLGLGLLGALLVAFGFGASLIGRRRQVV